MPSETDRLVTRLEDAHVETIGGWTFWQGAIDGHAVVISKTMKGEANVAAATAIAVEHFHPAAIINEGTAGGHDPQLHVYRHRPRLLRREPRIVQDRPPGSRGRQQSARLDAARSAGVGGQRWDGSQRAKDAAFSRRRQLLAAANSAKATYHGGRVVEGVIGSSDVWNSELDRIEQMHRQYGTTVEDMETASAAQIASVYRIPFLGIRVVSNNITNGAAYDGKAAEACQEFVYAVVKAHIAAPSK